MRTPSLKQRLTLFAYGTSNILGCACALLGPALLFAGVIDRGWLAITAGLYAIGWLLGTMAPSADRTLLQQVTAEQTLEALDRVIADADRFLEPGMRSNLASIRRSVADVLPRLPALGANEDVFTVRETVFRYLPETLANYAALPPAYRNTRPLHNGQTARQLLGEQLQILDGKMREVVENVSASDAQALVANGQFLEARFRQPDFLARS